MRPIRPMSAVRRGRRPGRGMSSALAAVSLATVLALTATACGSGDDTASDGSSGASAAPADGKIQIPDDLKERLKERGIDMDKWKNGEWKDWDKDKWLREARDFVNPIIKDLWGPDRMRDAQQPPEQPVADHDISGDAGVTDPTPQPVEAAAVSTPYDASSPASGKLFFDGPEGSMVCSATVVTDPAHPGKSNLVWTAGHCVHAGKKGGWYRNLVFVPSYNNDGLSEAALQADPGKQAPHGLWWADGALTSDQWIAQGSSTGGQGAPYDFAVIHVTPEKGGTGASLEETVGAALPVDFDAPATADISTVTATGYPAAPPFEGQKQFRCADRPGRLSLKADDPTMYRIGCTMTGGSSGGGWVAEGADGKPALVSNTSIGPVKAGWLAGPRLGDVAKGIYDAVSEKFAK
ncbi:trypsin-like serine peptidase [Streptomyces liangshanensis]|uniref:trypsin-like serine peptidase n=1 Tax=Streptomyces liangshanensis TaxID=2717324 RepID=UPI0036DDF95C